MNTMCPNSSTRGNDHFDLKIYLCGYLMDGPQDPEIHSLCSYLTDKTFDYFAAHPSRLADEIPRTNLANTAVERIARGSEVIILARFPDLKQIRVDR